MQKILAKYGLAAHLALLAVAPLFLFPFLQEAKIATVLLWLTALSIVWVVSSPSVHSGEMPHDARVRTWRHLVRDPLMWTMLVVVVFAGLRAANSGIARMYDPESGKWLIASAVFSWFPGSVLNSGYLPFAASVAFMVVTLGVRHALGGSARMAFLSMAAIFAGVAAAVALFAAQDAVAVKRAMECGIAAGHLVGTAFAVSLLGSAVALTAAFEHGWNRIMPLFVLFIGTDVVGSFAFLTPFAMSVFLLAFLILVGYAFFYLHKFGKGNVEYKFISIIAIALAIGVVVAFVMVPPEVLSARLGAFSDRTILGEEFLKVRSAVSEVAMRAWRAHAWSGIGCGATSLAIEFFAEDADWLTIPPGMATIPNGWLRLLTERGIVGLTMMMLPFGVLCFAYVCRLLAAGRFYRMAHPGCWLFPMAALALAAVAFFDVSPFRAEVLLLIGAMGAISVNSIITDRK